MAYIIIILLYINRGEVLGEEGRGEERGKGRKGEGKGE
jgi:hypothetical protein